MGDRHLHDLGRLQHEGQLHAAAREELADGLHAVEQMVVDDVERRVGLAAPSSRRLDDPPLLAVDDVVPKLLLERALDRGGGGVGGLDVLEEVDEAGERIERLVGDALGKPGAARGDASAVVDEIERRLPRARRSIRASGRIFAECTIAAVMPALTSSSRKTELSTDRRRRPQAEG